MNKIKHPILWAFFDNIFSRCFPGLSWLDNLWLHRVDNVNASLQFASPLLTWPKAAQRGKGLCGILLRLPSVHARKVRAGSQQELRPGAAHFLVPSDLLSNLIPASRALSHQSLIRMMPYRHAADQWKGGRSSIVALFSQVSLVCVMSP